MGAKGAKRVKVANRGQRGVNRGHFYTRFLGSPPPVGWGSKGSKQGAKGVKRSKGNEQGVKGAKGRREQTGSEGGEQGAKGAKAFLY